MSQPKRRASLLTGLASATAIILGLAPQPAHAQLQSYPGAGMAMPQAMLPQGVASGAPGYGGLGTPRSLNAAPQMPMMAPTWTYAPAFGVRPSYGPSYGQSYGRSPYNQFSQDAAPSSDAILPKRTQARRWTGPSVSENDIVHRTNGLLPPSRLTAPVRPTAPRNSGLSATLVPPAPAAGSNGNNTYLYAPSAPVTAIGGPALLGGYYYGGYCDVDYGTGTYPSIYSVYSGFPAYIYNPGVVYQTLGYAPTYITAALPFNPPQYQVTYNQTNYYVTSEDKAAQIEDGGTPAKEAVHQAFPADSYQAAFADIERAWTDGNLELIKNHLRSSDTKVSVFLNSKYKYSLASSDFGQITRDAFDRLDTVSFQFTRLRKAKNGDVTAFGKHVYRVGAGSDKSGSAASDNTVPFDDTAPSADSSTDAANPGTEKTVYVSYTLRHGDDGWYITAVDSASDPLVKEAA